MIVVLDIDLGNVGSIMNMLKKIGVPAVLASRCDEIEKAKKLILPGVGSFDQAMVNLSELKLIDVLNEKVTKEKIPVLGICLGAQIMTRSSEEGSRPGLGWIAGRTVRFDFRGEACKLKIPHMGWNHVQLRKESALLPQSAEPEDSRFYFVHAYHFLCDQEDDILAVSHYGYDFAAAFERDNVYGVQFHPEKSHKFGMKLFKNFAELEKN